MVQHLKPALLMLLFLSGLTGIAYPLFVTLGAQMIFPNQADGSLVLKNNRSVGSELIGQPFSKPEYFWGRPSATSPQPYNAAASGGSNQGPTNPALVDIIKSRIEPLKVVDPENKAPIPVDLITTSASGLDPHISPAAALYQINRVAKIRKIDPEQLTKLVYTYTEKRQWGVFGEPRVNVLLLNLALDDFKVATDDATNEGFTLPPSKAYAERCHQAALALHPGEILKQKELHRGRDYWVEYEIQMQDYTKWLVLCDLTSGQVMRDQKLDETLP